MLVCQKVIHSAHPINFAQHDLSLENNGGEKHAQNEQTRSEKKSRCDEIIYFLRQLPIDFRSNGFMQRRVPHE